jgi:uncharacterized protein (DUF362 family)
VKATVPPSPTVPPTVPPTLAPTLPPTPAATAAKAAGLPPTPEAPAYLAVARGPSPATITTQAIAAIGGMERFVKKGYDVIVKPNICNANNGPEYASTTNPEVVATLVKMCLTAGAKRVRVMDSPFAGTPQQAYIKSGVEKAVKEAGGEMEVMAPLKFVDTPIPQGQDIKKWPAYQPVLEANLVINVPIAKHHGLARLTLAGKNLLGVIEDRGSIHRNMGERVADLISLFNPQLTVIDAVRILVANGPTGGDLKDVKQTNTVIASHDVVAADAYATTLFGLTAQDISYVRIAAQRGLGNADLKSIKIAEING